MAIGLEALTSMEYPGRFIVLGFNEISWPTVIYGITGRSPSSQARKLVREGLAIKVEPTDPEITKQGDPNLLIYPAMMFNSGGISVSNGAQTESIYEASREIHIATSNSSLVVANAQRPWEHEPDSPNFTPRINGFMPLVAKANYQNPVFPAMGIIRKGRGDLLFSEKAVFQVLPIKGEGRFIATYEGENKDPLQAFVGEPRAISVPGKTSEETAHIFYDSMLVNKDMDFRVGVAVATITPERTYHKFIVNRNS